MDDRVLAVNNNLAECLRRSMKYEEVCLKDHVMVKEPVEPLRA